MEWINKLSRMPDKDPECDLHSKDVIVTDGENWGHGSYSYLNKYWVYYLVGHYEQVDNNAATIVRSH